MVKSVTSTSFDMESKELQIARITQVIRKRSSLLWIRQWKGPGVFQVCKCKSQLVHTPCPQRGFKSGYYYG